MNHTSDQRPAAINRSARSVAVLIGGLLLVAASLKLYGMTVSPLPSVGWMSLPVVQFAVVVWELLLGIWLISNLSRPLSGFLAYACGSIALATLLVGIMVGGGQQAWALEESEGNNSKLYCSGDGYCTSPDACSGFCLNPLNGCVCYKGPGEPHSSCQCTNPD